MEHGRAVHAVTHAAMLHCYGAEAPLESRTGALQHGAPHWLRMTIRWFVQAVLLQGAAGVGRLFVSPYGNLHSTWRAAEKRGRGTFLLSDCEPSYVLPKKAC